MPSITKSPAPPCSRTRAGRSSPASCAVGHRSGSSLPSIASRAASTVLNRDSAPRAASLRNSCSSVSAKFMTLRPQPPPAPWRAARSNGHALVEPRLRRQAEHALADHVAQDLLRPARGLEAREVGDESAQLCVAEAVGPSTSTRSSPAAIAALIVVTLASAPSGRGSAALQRGQHPVAGEAQREEVRGDLAVAVAHLAVAREASSASSASAKRSARQPKPSPPSPIATRSNISVVMPTPQPPLTGPTSEPGSSSATSSKKTSLKRALLAILAQRTPRHARRVHRDDEHGRLPRFRHVGVRAGEQQPKAACWAFVVDTFWPVSRQVPSSARLARVWMAARSEPAAGWRTAGTRPRRR